MRRARTPRWWWLLAAGLLLLVVIATRAGDPPADRAATAGTPAPPTTSAAPQARASGNTLVRQGRYAAAIAAFEAAGLDADADRARRAGARALSRSARRALDRADYAKAKRLALASRRLHRTAAAGAIVASARAGLARAAAARRERLRLARIARDARTCSSSEKRTVKDAGGVPAGCATYAAALARRRAAEAAKPAESCDPNYEGACLDPDSPDYDCRGGSGDGPDYTGPVTVVGSDPYDLDRDGDGAACETS